MATITFNTAHQAGQVRQRRQTAFAFLREMLDAFVSYRMRLAAAEAEHARRPQLQRTSSSQPKNAP